MMRILLAAVGVGSILVPYPYAVDNHQTVNALHLVNAGAALMIQQSKMTVNWLAEKLCYFIDHPDELVVMALAAYSISTPDAASKVAAQVAQLAAC